jgi:hypothetical protein
MKGDLAEPHVLNLGTSWRLIVSVELLLNYNHGKKVGAP